MTNLTKIQVEEIEEDGLSYKDLESLTTMLIDLYEGMSLEQFLEMEYGIKDGRRCMDTWFIHS